MGERIYINDNWKFLHGDKCTSVRLPHSVVETSFHYFNEDIYQIESMYEKVIFASEDWRDKIATITFEGVAHVATVLINGREIGTHFGGYTAFSIDISNHIEYGKENIISVKVDSRESCNIPPFGGVIDYLTYGGIYRDVYLEIANKTHIKDIYITTQDKSLSCEVEVCGELENATIELQIRRSGDFEWENICNSQVKFQKIKLESRVEKAEKWDIENPTVYQLNAILKCGEKTCDNKTATFGFKDSVFKTDGFYLNGRKLKILGLNRHQSYPYVGYAMPKRPQVLDADILKFELGLNAVRTSHYPQSEHFLNRCDEIGLLVFTEIPGWQHIGNQEWKDRALQMAKEMVLQNRNHPSIVLWGARINESPDDDEFYKLTNQEIRSLDPSRQTGGVRFIKNSNLLEDVYTYNDFSHTGENLGLEGKSKVTSNQNAPYLVSEYNGHMFPTKGFDCESHRLEHAKRHANVVESLFENSDIAGGFGWCMFDYNTHKDFGSGDGICYHGVMNMFRVPKLAASVYASQSDGKDILCVSSSMDIGEHAAGHIKEVYVFTNAEFVNLYKNGEFVKRFYPDEKRYSNMPHPPILIDDFIGELIEKHEGFSHKNAEIIKEVLGAIVKFGQNNLPLKYKLKMAKVMLYEKLTFDDGVRLFYTYVSNWGGEATTYQFEGVRNNKVISTATKTATNKVVLKVTCDSQVLKEEESYDVASVRVQITNEHGEILPYYQGVVHFEAEGDVEIIGVKAVSAIGGGVGTYVKTIGKSGFGTLKISSGICESVVLKFEIL